MYPLTGAQGRSRCGGGRRGRASGDAAGVYNNIVHIIIAYTYIHIFIYRERERCVYVCMYGLMCLCIV